MKTMRRCRNCWNKVLTAVTACCFSLLVYGQQGAHTAYVDPFIGTGATGHTFPGACVPFGMVQASPVTGAIGWDYCAEYNYADTTLWGFTQDHLNGTGCMDLGDVLIMPFNSDTRMPAHRATIDKSSERARPGYYSVEFRDGGIRTEITAAEHVAFYRFTFHRADSAAVLVNISHAPSWNENQYRNHVRSKTIRPVATDVSADGKTVISRLWGRVETSVWVEREVYFCIDFGTPAVQQSDSVYTFPDLRDGDVVELKVALSTTAEGPAVNMAADLPHWDFDRAVQHADSVWEHFLSRIDIEGSREQKVNFYTALYHTLIQPNNIADADGRYQTAKGTVAVARHDGKMYSTFSCWDTYRALHPLYTLVVPELVGGMVASLIEQADVIGWIPIWSLWGRDNYCMVANHGVSIVAEACLKGLYPGGEDEAMDAIRRTLTRSHPQKSDWDTYMRYGYFPSDMVRAESVSSTLESVYDDYAAWMLAKHTGSSEDADYFARRKDFYRNLFDPTTRFMRPRMSDGSWRTPFDPTGLDHESSGGDYTEGNAWQYTWHVQHDVDGLIRLMGGRKAFVARLDTFFTKPLASTLSDVTGLIGQYAHGNEPSHHVAYLYTLASCPWRTQELVRQIFETQYNARPDGLCGNDDCGQMSAWYILSAMGFYPVDPVSAQYVLGAPQLPRITLHLTDGSTFTITANGISDEALYINKVYLNGHRYRKWQIAHTDITAGGTLTFDMSSRH